MSPFLPHKMSSGRSRYFCVVDKRKREEEPTLQNDCLASEDGDDSESTSTSKSPQDLKSPVDQNNRDATATATNPLIIDEDSDSEVEVLPIKTVIPSSPSDDAAKGRKLHGEVPKSHPICFAMCPDQTSLQKDDTPSNERKENRFSKYAFAAGGGRSEVVVSQQPPIQPTFSWRSSNTPVATLRVPISDKISTTSTSLVLKKPPGVITSSNHHQQHQGKKKKTCDFIPMGSISKEEQDIITRKWHSLADPLAPLEVRRFQVFVAARLHARCQEPSIRKAMSVLREAFGTPSTTTTTPTTTTSEEDDGIGLNVSTVARADPQVLALHLTNLQYYNVKAQHIVKAAKEIETEFHGRVPEDETSLLRLTGVGKVFADLLAFVNTRKIHQRFMVVNHDASMAMDDTSQTSGPLNSHNSEQT